MSNCNSLLNQAEADYVLFAFHDDILNPDYITLLAEVLDARPEVVMSYSDVHLTNTNGTEEHWVFTELECVRDPVQRGVLMMSGKNKWSVPNRGLFRLGQARQINGLKTHHAGEFSRLAMAVPYEPFERIRTGSQNPVLQVLQAWKLIEKLAVFQAPDL